MNRREVIRGGLVLAGATLSGCTRAAAKPFFATHDLPIGIQLYTLDPDLDRDLEGTLKALAAIGYRSVEMAGLHGRTAADWRAALDRHGLTCPSMHIQPAARGNGASFADPAALARDVHTIGATTAVLPIPLFPTDFRPPAETNAGDGFRLSGKAMTRDDWKRTADFLNASAGALAPEGIRVGFHNHNFGFAPLDGGSTGFELLLAATDPGAVTFEMDAGWVVAGGGDPIALLETHRGRFTQMHVKDVKASTRTNFEVRQDPTEVGGGVIDWKTILPVAYAAGVREYYVEQEPPFPRERIDSVTKSYRYLAALATA